MTTPTPETLTPGQLADWAADCFSALGTLTKGQADFVLRYAAAWEAQLEAERGISGDLAIEVARMRTEREAVRRRLAALEQDNARLEREVASWRISDCHDMLADGKITATEHDRRIREIEGGDDA